MSDRDELIKLRIAIARMAQAARVLPFVHGDLTISADDNWNTLQEKASKCDRGWNALAGVIVGEVSRLTN
jgi:hypothetical protein